ncbi:HEAT repeat domain-containing protein [Paludibacterium yongneupense]|uniref:HEAT repeat domain-containing protein n=1 Tax=Paludibacterium yongneupense TaxID=400061 RepID=UPI0003FC10EA|nr:HEAT repeat domain-containing protein [Paludibacterium yongneupense]
MAFVKPPVAQPHRDDQCLAPRDFTDLVAELSYPNPAARRWAARDLAAYPEASLALMACLKEESHPSVREALLTSLTLIGDEVAVAGLVDCLRSEQVGLRNEAVEVMKELPEKVAPIMENLLADENPDVRIFAVNILESLRHPLVERWLIDVIEREPHVNVCGTAVDLLCEVGTPAAREALTRLEARFPDEPYIQFAAELALKRLGED